MANQIAPSADLLTYVRDMSLRDDEILRELRETTAALPAGTAMQVTAEEGQLLALLARLTAARLVVEVGTFTGYSTLCMARALPEDGRLITLDATSRWPDIGAEYWRRAGVADRIDVRVGDARQTLPALLAEIGPASVDLVFIDADKGSYASYYETAVDLVRPCGLIVLDNTLFFGRVVRPDINDPDTEGIRAVNARLRDDDRVDISLLVMADGITLARKRAG